MEMCLFSVYIHCARFKVASSSTLSKLQWEFFPTGKPSKPVQSCASIPIQWNEEWTSLPQAASNKQVATFHSHGPATLTRSSFEVVTVTQQWTNSRQTYYSSLSTLCGEPLLFRTRPFSCQSCEHNILGSNLAPFASSMCAKIHLRVHSLCLR